MNSGDLFVISAPSGTGKTTLIRRLLAGMPGLEFSISYTTRGRRHGEIDGVDYHFVDAGGFDRMLRDGDLLEWAVVHGHRYGTCASQVDRAVARGLDVLLDIDSQGAASVRRLRPAAVMIFILPPDFESLESRLRGRGLEGEEEVARRLAAARLEATHWAEYDYVVINDDFDRALRALESIVLARRAARQRQGDACRRVLESFDAAS